MKNTNTENTIPDNTPHPQRNIPSAFERDGAVCSPTPSFPYHPFPRYSPHKGSPPLISPTLEQGKGCRGRTRSTAPFLSAGKPLLLSDGERQKSPEDDGELLVSQRPQFLNGGRSSHPQSWSKFSTKLYIYGD